MKTLYYFTKTLSFPFYLIVAVLNALSLAFEWAGDAVYNATTYRVWLVLNERACAKSALENAVVSHAASEPRPLDPSQPVGTTRPR